MTKTNFVLIAAMGFVGVAGCGGGDEGVAFTEDEYCNQRAAGECASLAGGCTFSAADTAACTPKRKTVCVQEAAALKSPPKRVFREAKGKACVAESKKLFTGATLVPSATWMTLKETCARTFEGEAKATEACLISLDCVSGLTCDKMFCGVAKTVAAGQGCANPGEQCGAGQYCTLSGTLYKCENRLALDQACNATKVCAENLRCLDGFCKERLVTGDTCVADGDCASTLICDPFVRKCSTTINLATQCTVLGAGGGASPDASAGG